MKWCVDFPEESMLVIRPSLDALCYSIKPAAKLLGVLLYRYSIRQEHQQDAENINEVAVAQGKEGTQDASFYIYRKQSQLVADMIGEMTEKTLHDVAIPTLQLLGYLDVDETPIIHKYDLHVDVVRKALVAYKKSPIELFAFLLGHLQLEKFLIETDEIQLEEFLINKKYFQLALEKVLIANRKSSNNKRGRKTRQERASLALSEAPKISLEIDSEIGNKDREYGANAPTPAHLKEEHEILFEEATEKLEEVKRITDSHLKAVKPTENETQYHIANDTIGNEELLVVGAQFKVVKPAKGATHDGHTRTTTSIVDDRGRSQPLHNLPGTRGDQNRTTTTQQQGITSQQAPGTSALPPVADPPVSHASGIGGVQAQPPLVDPDTAQAPPTESTSTLRAAPASGFVPPKRPGRGKPAVLELSFGGADVKKWIEEIRGVKLRMTSGNVKACNALAECDGISLEALRAYFAHVEAQKWEVDLLTAAGETGNDKVGFLSFESNWPKLMHKQERNGKKLNGKPQSRPTLDEVECVDPTWCVYKRPGDDQEWILWQGELCTPQEADERGYAGGGGLYIQTKYR